MTTTLATTDGAAIVERVVIAGDLSKLSPPDRVAYYRATCDSLGLNPLTKPFEYIELDGKLTLYATRTATDQLRELKGVSLRLVRKELNADLNVYIVEVEAVTPDGRQDFATGVVPIAKEDGEWKTSQNGRRYFAGNGEWKLLRGADLANALMKAETKAKRRATLSICGLGWMDETELDTVPSAQRVRVDAQTGEIVGHAASSNGKRERIIERLRALVSEAAELGIEITDFDTIEGRSDSELFDAGKALRARLDAIRAEREAEYDAIDVALDRAVAKED